MHVNFPPLLKPSRSFQYSTVGSTGDCVNDSHLSFLLNSVSLFSLAAKWCFTVLCHDQATGRVLNTTSKFKVCLYILKLLQITEAEIC